MLLLRLLSNLVTTQAGRISKGINLIGFVTTARLKDIPWKIASNSTDIQSGTKEITLNVLLDWPLK